MIRITVCVAAIALASPAFCQSFEVASIKPAAPQPMGMRVVRMGGDPGRINYEGVTLRQLLARAYNVKDYQITGPDWLTSERYDVVAKLPDGADRNQVPQMLQALLADRFKLGIRKEEKELPVYELLVGKNGPKLKVSQGIRPEMLPDNLRAVLPKAPADGASDDKPAATPAGKPVAPEGKAAQNAAKEKAVSEQLGIRPAGGGGGMIRINDGHVEMNNTSMPGFANYLSNVVGRPVLDKTELQGNYDIILDVDPGEFMGNMKRSFGVQMGEPGGAARAEASPAPESTGGSIFTAVQQLGLKLEGRKAPVEMIVVDHAEKVPTEN